MGVRGHSKIEQDWLDEDFARVWGENEEKKRKKKR